jgi:hypothetical protein
MTASPRSSDWTKSLLRAGASPLRAAAGGLPPSFAERPEVLIA